MAGAVRSAWHSVVAGRIQGWFEAAGHTAVREIGVVVGPGDVSTPDITVFQDRDIDLTATQFSPIEVACAIEVVSPDSLERDRSVKPVKYAAAGIPQFWLVEEHPDLAADAVIQVFTLVHADDKDSYELTRTVVLSDLEQEFS